MASIFFACLASKSKSRILIFLFSALCILIPAALGGLRALTIGTDTKIYGINDIRVASNAGNFTQFFLSIRREPGYAFVCYYSTKFFGHENLVLFVYQIITLVCFYIGAWKQQRKGKSCFILPFIMMIFFFMFYNTSFNLMRQIMAASIIFMGMNELENRQYKIFLIYILFASLFHYSAIVTIFLVLGMHKITSSEKFIKIWLLRLAVTYTAILLLVLTRPLFSAMLNLSPLLSRYSFYIENSIYDDTEMFIVLIFLCEYFAFILYPEGAKRVLGCGNSEFYKLNLIFMSAFQIFVRLIPRILLYSEFANIIVLAAIPRFIFDKNLRFLVSTAIIFVTVLYWYRVFVLGESSQTWPYKSIL